ncbi:hypothetical protein ACFQ60_29670 [Streptomyces zhihengii]
MSRRERSPRRARRARAAPRPATDSPTTASADLQGRAGQVQEAGVLLAEHPVGPVVRLPVPSPVARPTSSRCAVSALRRSCLAASAASAGPSRATSRLARVTSLSAARDALRISPRIASRRAPSGAASASSMRQNTSESPCTVALSSRYASRRRVRACATSAAVAVTSASTRADRVRLRPVTQLATTAVPPVISPIHQLLSTTGELFQHACARRSGRDRGRVAA